MTHKLTAECPVLQTHRQVPLCPAPLSYPLEHTGKAVLRSLALDHPASFTGLTPEVSEAQQIETARTVAPVIRALKVHQFRLLRMQGQSILAESL